MTQDATLPKLPTTVSVADRVDATPDLAEVFATHGDYVWNALRRLGVPHDELQDLTHDAFLGVLRAWDDYDPQRPVRPWLFVFALRVASDHRRRRARQPVDLVEHHDPPDNAPNASELLEQREREALAHAALQSVVLSRRAVFILHELDECTIPEIAAALEIPVATAYSRLRLAREDFASAVRRLAKHSR